MRTEQALVDKYDIEDQVMYAVSFDSEVKLDLKMYSTFETGRMME